MLQKFDERNKHIKIYVNGELLDRDNARISVFDSVVQGGDAVWEGLRLYAEGIFLLERHLDRLMDSAHAMAFENVPSRKKIKEALSATLKANNMQDGVHIRLTLTRGEKLTSGMDPRLNTKGCGLIVLAEYKAPVYDNREGIRIISSTIRRNSPNHIDSKIHHNNLINNIMAKIQANISGVDAALMLDIHGFASELNGTNIFMIRSGKIFTPYADACLPGITRSIIMEIAVEMGLDIMEKNISLTELYNADEVFCTGTMGELTPITEIDGRRIMNKQEHSILTDINTEFKKKIPLLSVPVV